MFKDDILYTVVHMRTKYYATLTQRSYDTAVSIEVVREGIRASPNERKKTSMTKK